MTEIYGTFTVAHEKQAYRHIREAVHAYKGFEVDYDLTHIVVEVLSDTYEDTSSTDPSGLEPHITGYEVTWRAVTR